MPTELTEPQKLWVEALRSGEYEQGKGKLCINGCFCCLGVACDVYQKQVGGLEIGESAYADGNTVRNYCGHTNYMPQQVQSWIGLKQNTGRYHDGCLANLNDNGSTFAAIADLIESRPPGLFVEPT